jgi:hypothetical protein
LTVHPSWTSNLTYRTWRETGYTYRLVRNQKCAEMTRAILTQCLKSGIGILLCLLIISTATFGAFLMWPTTLHCHITEHYSLTAKGEHAAVYLGILVPKNGPYQTIEGMRVSWDGKQIREINPCVDVIKLSGSLAAGSNQDAVIDYEVSLSHGIVLWRAQADSCHLLPQCKIESDNPIIVAQANQIAFCHTSPPQPQSN